MFEIGKCNSFAVIQLASLFFFSVTDHVGFLLSFWLYKNFLSLNKSKTAKLLLNFSLDCSPTADIIILLLECDLIFSILAK